MTGVDGVAVELNETLTAARPRLEAISAADSLRTRGPGTWSRREILGHLIDSALNNLHRFVRAQSVDELVFPDYDQPSWVAAQGHAERSWTELVELWVALNRHAAHVIARIPPDRLQTPCRIGPSRPLPLEFIVRDYLKHLKHHLDQILEPEASLGKAHPPWGA